MTVTRFDEAMQFLSNYEDLKLHAKDIDEDLKNAITSTDILRTISAVPTLRIGLNDPQRVIATSGIVGDESTMRLGMYTYEMVQFSKTGPTLTLTLEDHVVSALRKHNSPIKVAAGKMTHVEFAKMLVKEEPWIDFITVPDPSKYKVVKSKGPLLRGDPTKKGRAAEESTWNCLSALASARGWRVFPRGASQLWYVPDPYLYAADAEYTLIEGQDGIDAIDFDYDQGKKTGTCQVTARVDKWGVPVGVTVNVKGSGPVDGKWLTLSIERPATSLAAAIILTQPQPILAEPKGAASSDKITLKGLHLTVATGGPAPKVTTTAKVADFVKQALSQIGKPYVYGAQTTPSNASPSSFDCSLLVEWAAGRVGVSLPRTAEAQFEVCNNAHTTCSVEHGIHTLGALLFEGGSDPSGTFGIGHVAISLGNGKTMEAMGKAYGTNEQGATGRDWSHAALIPSMVY